MTQGGVCYNFGRNVRVTSTEDFGKVIQACAESKLALGRDVVSVGVRIRSDTKRVRFGFTVGKHHVPRSVDRVLVKRVMRDVARHALPQLQVLCEENRIGLDVVLRIRRSFGTIGSTITVSAAKRRIRMSTQECVVAVAKRIGATVAEKG